MLRLLNSPARKIPTQASRSFQSTSWLNDKVVAVLYPDPLTGYPPLAARDDIPKIEHYPDGMSTPNPKSIDFRPGQLLGCVSGELGLRKWLEDEGHEFVVTADKDGEGCEFEEHLKDAHYIISQPFYPAYLTKKRIEMVRWLKYCLLASSFLPTHISYHTSLQAPNLKASITAGIGSDHVDLTAAMEHNVDVLEVTFCNSISVSEHVVMMILGLVRNYIPSYKWATKTDGASGGWNIADCVQRSYDVEGMNVGTVAAGRIGLAVLKRLHPFDCKLHYCDRHRLPKSVEEQYNLTYWENWKEMIKEMDVVTLNCPLHSETQHMINSDTISLFKRGTYLVNTARGKLCDRDVIAQALKDNHLAGYAGDVSRKNLDIPSTLHCRTLGTLN